MAAAKLNIPSVVVPCGYQANGSYQGHHCDIEEVFIGAMHVVTGAMDVDTVIGMSRKAIRSPGMCSGMGTANSMHIVCEALGMALPGSARRSGRGRLGELRHAPIRWLFEHRS